MANISTLHIHLLRQRRPELVELYKLLSSEEAQSKWTIDDLIQKIISVYTLNDVLQKWDRNVNAFNTSLTVFKMKRKSIGYKNFMKDLVRDLDKEFLKKIEKGEYSGSLTVTPKLIELINLESSYYFMFAVKGRNSKILDGLSIKNISRPSFVVLRIDDKNGTTEIRGQKSQGERALKVLKKFLKIPSDVFFTQSEVTDENGVRDLCKKLKGKPVKATLQDNDAKDLLKADLHGKKDIDIYGTEEYKELKSKGYADAAGGISFPYKRKSYIIDIGFTTGTFWFRSGKVDEDVIRKVVREVSKL